MDVSGPRYMYMSNLGDSCRRIVPIHAFSYGNRDDYPFGGDQANPGSCLGFQVVEITGIQKSDSDSGRLHLMFSKRCLLKAEWQLMWLVRWLELEPTKKLWRNSGFIFFHFSKAGRKEQFELILNILSRCSI